MLTKSNKIKLEIKPTTNYNTGFCRTKEDPLYWSDQIKLQGKWITDEWHTGHQQRWRS